MNQLPVHLQNRLEDVIHSRFFDRIGMYELYLWLDNFRPEEYDMAISVLEHIDFYRESDFYSLLWQAVESLHLNYAHSRLYFIPIGKAGKSGDIIIYQIKKILSSHYIKATCCYSCLDLQDKELQDNDYVIFVDDFIGTGGSFMDYIDKNPVAQSLLGHTNVILLCGIMMDLGKRNLEKHFSQTNLKIATGDIKYRAFETGHYVFGGYIRTKRIREFCYAYGEKLYKNNALGYKNSQSLVIIEHSSPNNSLPIIWSDNEINGRKWNPLVPRSYRIKENRSCVDRKDNNRWLYLLRRTIGVNENDSLTNVFTSQNYTLIMILRYLMDRKTESAIANFLGLTPHDMAEFKKEGVDLKLWDENWAVHPYVINQFKEALSYWNRKISEKVYEHDLISDDRNNIYIPETFRGLK